MAVLGGALRTLSAPHLAAAVLTRLLEDAGTVSPGGLVLGQAVQAGAGAHPARTAALLAGLPQETWAFTVNQGAASSLQAIFQAAQSLRPGQRGRVLAGGMESSSAAPYLLPTARWGTRMGSAPVLDALVLDGQEWTAAPLAAAEAARVRHNRARAAAAREAGLFRSQITPVNVPGRRGLQVVSEDESGPEDGLVPGDGAAALLLASGTGLGTRAPLARIRATAQGADTTQAIRRLLQRTGLALEAIDRFEVEEASPTQRLALMASCPGLAPERVNVLGGALALGQPLGAMGAHMVASLAHQMEDNGLSYGLVVLGIQGSGMALLLERP